LVGGLNPNGLKTDPYTMRWELVGIHPQNNLGKTQNEIINILKEALTAYGHLGVHKQVPNTVVEFNF
ncbi:MAG: hypothetical protein ABW159_18735, partial [Candidatus Thiodiazotropha sp.]